jgi:hypothetical protein
VGIEPLPNAPAAGAPAYLESIDLEVGFLKRAQESAEQFSADEMGRNFINAFGGQIFAVGELLIFDFRGIALKATVIGLQTLELADNQRRSASSAPSNMGLLMDKTDVNLIKAGDSAIKIKSSAKKWAYQCYYAAVSSCIISERLLMPSWLPTSNSRIWASVVSTLSLATSSVVPSHPVFSRRVLWRSSVFST